MANRHRGEIEAEIGGARRRLVLTLGALAELESAFGAEDLVALTERFASGRLAARDLTRIIGAGLRGAIERAAVSLAAGNGLRAWRVAAVARTILAHDATRTGLRHRSAGRAKRAARPRRVRSTDEEISR